MSWLRWCGLWPLAGGKGLDVEKGLVSPVCQPSAAVLGALEGLELGQRELEECPRAGDTAKSRSHAGFRSATVLEVLDHPSILTFQGSRSHIESHLVTATKNIPALASSSDCRLCAWLRSPECDGQDPNTPCALAPPIPVLDGSLS